MDKLFSRIKKIFSPNPKSATPFMHEVIARSEDDLRSYEEWKSSHNRERMLEEVRLGYNNGAAIEEVDNTNVIVIKSPSTHGFLFYFDPNEYDKIDFQHCFDYLKEKVAEQGYTSYLSDVQTNVREECVEVKERHYLKPRYNYDEKNNKSHQLYGNITIEHIMHDDHPDHIKFYSSHYNDHKYHDVQDFDELVKTILN